MRQPAERARLEQVIQTIRRPKLCVVISPRDGLRRGRGRCVKTGALHGNADVKRRRTAYGEPVEPPVVSLSNQALPFELLCGIIVPESTKLHHFCHHRIVVGGESKRH